MDGPRFGVCRLRGAPAVILACIGLAGAFFVSCANLKRSVVSVPTIEGATFVGNARCVDCHSNYTRVFPSSPHARIHVAEAPRGEATGCESCHGPGSLHVQAGGGR